jgi:hypothetical protein
LSLFAADQALFVYACWLYVAAFTAPHPSTLTSGHVMDTCLSCQLLLSQKMQLLGTLGQTKSVTRLHDSASQLQTKLAAKTAAEVYMRHTPPRVHAPRILPSPAADSNSSSSTEQTWSYKCLIRLSIQLLTKLRCTCLLLSKATAAHLLCERTCIPTTHHPFSHVSAASAASCLHSRSMHPLTPSCPPAHSTA